MMFNFISKTIFAAILLCVVQVGIAQSPVKIIVNTDIEKEKINKHIYGHFAEHLGRCVYDGIYVGDNNTKIKHENGVRTDIIQALKDLKVPNLRWPGGCFADAYQWKNGIGPKAERPKMVNLWWGRNVEDNSFGTHEFLDLCEKIGTQPYLAANVGSGSVQDLMDWVDYVNSTKPSEMVLLRQKNGRKDPWNVKLWGVGNEAWGCGGNMTADYYANVYRQYATFMTDWTNGSGLYRIASGATDGEYAWTESLMKNIPHNMVSGLALHHYSVLSWAEKGPSVGFTEAQYFKTMHDAFKIDEFIKGHSTIMDKYDPQNKVSLIVDEWGGWYETDAGGSALYQQNTMRDAMIAGLTLNIFHNNARRVKGANLAQVVNVLQSVILTKEEKMILTPTYHVMRMYNVHQDANLLDANVLNGTNYEFNGQKIPNISVSASKDSTGVVTISVVNLHYTKSEKIDIDLRGQSFTSCTGELLTSAKVDDHNSFENGNKITPKSIKNISIKNNLLNVEIPPFSVAVYRLK
ncbi:MAG TPA: alpha-L-arabinofuranosidase C-terminal domain-containing protein [Saprospiraceae bacterium]|nr:alpha-L-arabinofuranosidase C-terminal domain-containing protein [Saprospiraceae bacterium]